jgi:DNA-binding MarR family transcriptional regulator
MHHLVYDDGPSLAQTNEAGMAVSGEQTHLPDAVVDALMRASRALVAVTARSLSSVNDEVTLAQFRTLIVLSSQGPQTVTALAEHLDVHASTMTRMCTRLVTRGLVVRVPSAVDRREVVITLSTNGSRLVDDVLNNRRAEFDAIVQRLSEEHRHTLIGALDAFSRAAIDEDPSGRNGEIASDRAFISPEETS